MTAHLNALRERNNWRSAAPKAAGGGINLPMSASSLSGDAPLKRLLDPLYEKLYDFCVDEKNLSNLVGDVDVSWLAGRATLDKRRR